MRKRSLLVAALLAVAVVAVLWRSAPGTKPAATASSAAETAPAGPAAPTASAPVLATGTPIELSDDDQAFLTRLREKFAPHIAGKHARIKLIEQLIAYLQAHYPADWPTRLRAFLQALFPELAEVLFRQFEQLQQHNAWLAANRELLLSLPPQERRERLWQARRDAFGADAEEIWAGELRGEQLRDRLAALDADPTLNAETRFSAYLEAIEQSYGETAPAFIESRRTELINRFLDLPSVQTELRAMAPMARSATLRAMRSQAGMDSAALDRWDTLDHQRDRQWDLGQQYLHERARLLAADPAAARNGQLAALQDRLFGDEAETLRSEEAAGFLRFAGERRIGRE
jgi:hypothetical protein